MDAFYVFFVALFGLIAGSFSSALIYRVPRAVPWFILGCASRGGEEGTHVDVKRSSCVQCGHKLAIRDLVPLFSFLLSKGRCRYCGSSISLMYLYVELACLALALAAYFSLGLTFGFYVFMAAIPILTALLFIELEPKILPNSLVLIAAVLGVVFLILKGFIPYDQGYSSWLLDHLAGFIVYPLLLLVTAIIMQKVMKKDVLGMGDIKFLAVAGLWLGLSMLPLYCLLTGLLGIGFGLFWKSIKGEALFPFGPALILTFIVLFLLQNSKYDFLRDVAYVLL